MAINFANFLGQARAPDLSGIGNIVENIGKGYTIGRIPETLRQEEEGRMRDNALKALREALMKSQEGRAAQHFAQEQQDREYLRKVLEGYQQPEVEEGAASLGPQYAPGTGMPLYTPEARTAEHPAQAPARRTFNAKALEENPLARALFRKQYGFDPVKQELSFMGPAREAMDLERLKQQAGEESEVYQNALKSYRAKQKAQGDLSETRQARLGGLSPGEAWIRDDEGNIVGKKTKVSAEDKKEYKGRASFNYTYPLMSEGLGNFAGQGSILKFADAVNNYGINPAATKAIDDFLLGRMLVSSSAIKEAATLGGGRTLGVFKSLSESLDTSDLPKTVEKIAKQFGLPNEAIKKANRQFQDVIKESTRRGDEAVPAFNAQYFEPGKRRQSLRDREDESIGENKHLINKDFSKMSDEELAALAQWSR